MEETKKEMELEENEILRISVTKNLDSGEICFLVDTLPGDEDAKEIEEAFLAAMKNKYLDFTASEE